MFILLVLLIYSYVIDLFTRKMEKEVYVKGRLRFYRNKLRAVAGGGNDDPIYRYIRRAMNYACFTELEIVCERSYVDDFPTQG